MTLTANVTASEDVLRKLRLSEQLFYKAFEEAAIGMALMSSDGNFLRVNQALCKLVGYSKEELESKTFQDITHPADLDADLNFVQQMLRGEISTYQMEKRYIHKTGRVVWILLAVSMVRDELTSEQFFVAQIQDITSRKRAQEQLRYSEERFSKAFRSCPLPISISTILEGRYLDVNDAFLRMIGRRREEVTGRRAMDLNIWAFPLDRDSMLRKLEREGRVDGLETVFNSGSNGARTVQLFAERVYLDGVPCLLAITHDVTDAKRMEDQFRQAQKMEAMGLLAGGVAHDFNNMLGIISGYCDLAEGRHDVEACHSDIDQIRKAADRATNLTRQLLSFSRQQIVRPSVLNLNNIIKDLNQMLRRVLPSSIELCFNPGESLQRIKADLGQIEQILINLVVNARDAMPDGGKIVIETANLELDDTGCGIDSKTISRIFEPFFTTKPRGEGTGLGLSMVYGAVQESRGHIVVASEVGHGTTFTLHFPVIEEVVESVPSLAVPTLKTGCETILVVEDEPVLRGLIVELLESEGYTVLQAADAEAATGVSAQCKDAIHVLLADVGLPGVSGFDLAAQLVESRPGLKVLFTSAYQDGSVNSSSKPEQKANTLEKPFTKRALLRAIQSLLDHPRQKVS